VLLQPAGSTSGKHNTGKGQESISGQSNQADGEKGILHNFLLLFSNYYRNPLERQIGVFFRIAGAQESDFCLLTSGLCSRFFPGQSDAGYGAGQAQSNQRYRIVRIGFALDEDSAWGSLNAGLVVETQDHFAVFRHYVSQGAALVCP